MSREKNGISNVLRYDTVQGNTVYFEDLGPGGQRSATFNAGTGEGQLLLSEGTYKFVVDPVTKDLAMDQTNNNDIGGDEAKWVLPGGSIIDFGPGFTVRLITPKRLFDEATADEITKFDIIFGSNIDLDVQDPQTTMPGYELDLVSSGGGVRQGLTKYGALLTWDKESDADDLKFTVPGAYARSAKGGATGEVFITFDRDSIMRETQQAALVAQCGDRIITDPEVCDPPGSLCADPYFKKSGVCSENCASCLLPTCGNNLLEQGEDCESSADCDEGYGCSACSCVEQAPAVCGNNLIENGEECEKNIDCGVGFVCSDCGCLAMPQPVIEQPAPVRQPNIFARFFTWLASLFGA